jgi:hypothetical protein
VLITQATEFSPERWVADKNIHVNLSDCNIIQPATGSITTIAWKFPILLQVIGTSVLCFSPARHGIHLSSHRCYDLPCYERARHTGVTGQVNTVEIMVGCRATIIRLSPVRTAAYCPLVRSFGVCPRRLFGSLTCPAPARSH